jgi:hypothetical protein
MDANLQDEDEEVFVVPIMVGAATLRRLMDYARLLGEKPIVAAEWLLEDVLHDTQLWDSVEDLTGVEPTEGANASEKQRTRH